MATIDTLSHVSKSEYLDPTTQPSKFEFGDWVRVEFDFAGFPARQLYGMVTGVSPCFPDGTYNLNIASPLISGDGGITVPAVYCSFLGYPVAKEGTFDEFINQGWRSCEVTEVKTTRFRLEWEKSEKMMTAADKRRKGDDPGTQGGWRTGTRIGGRLFYPCGQQRKAPKCPQVMQGEALDAFIRNRTAFDSLEDMCTAAGGYRPTIRVDAESGFLQLADAYDQAQIKRGDPRRAFRG